MKRITVLCLLNLSVVAMLLILFEGLSSYIYVGYNAFARGPIAERKHTEYDEELGWVNVPNVHIEDMYGPGASLTTNAQRYRNRNEFGFDVPDGKLRIICSGDSFTLGYGVDDDLTWCQLLADMDARIETVNLGQGGYGADQAYLWYRRNEDKLAHDIHIFAFITSDFKRMQRDSFLGYGKPFLIVQNESLHQTNRPVSKSAYYTPYLTSALARLGMLAKELRTVTLLRDVIGQSTSDSIPFVETESSRRTQDVVSMIFKELQQTNRLKQSLFVLVYLPSSHREYMGDDETEYWRKYVQREAEQNGYVFFDMIEELRARSPDSVKKLFKGHYSVDGNKFVAEALFRRLKNFGAISN